MNRYVIIFTVVTVLFLTPNIHIRKSISLFRSLRSTYILKLCQTVFALDFFKKADPSQSIRNYKITTVILSLVTYLTAGICIMAVNWWHIKDRVHIIKASLQRRRHSTTERRDMGGEKSNDVAGVETNDALPAAETEPASGKAEHHGHKSAAATRDLERAVEEANTGKKLF